MRVLIGVLVALGFALFVLWTYQYAQADGPPKHPEREPWDDERR